MAARFHLRCATLFRASPEEVWALKTNWEKMQDEFRPLFQGTSSEGEQALAALKQGNLPVNYTLSVRLGGLLPIGHWDVEVSEYEEGRFFVDSSENRVFSAWRHEHRIEPSSLGTRYVDLVDFQPRGRAVHWTAIALRELFLHRHRRAAQHLPTEVRATAIATLRKLA